MKSLLKKIELVNYKYSLIERDNKFNIFEILRDKNDEVHLHSRFIYELLNPKGSHKYGSLLTQSLLKIIGIEDFNIESYSILKEYKNIDILIKNETQAIIIEN